jgi:hypothetical protein
MRLAPVSGTTSATVAMATRSNRALRLGSLRVANQPSSRSFLRSPMQRLKATPAAHRCLVGYSQPGWCGLSTATAGGSVGGTVW